MSARSWDTDSTPGTLLDTDNDSDLDYEDDDVDAVISLYQPEEDVMASFIQGARMVLKRYLDAPDRCLSWLGEPPQMSKLHGLTFNIVQYTFSDFTRALWDIKSGKAIPEPTPSSNRLVKILAVVRDLTDTCIESRIDVLGDDNVNEEQIMHMMLAIVDCYLKLFFELQPSDQDSDGLCGIKVLPCQKRPCSTIRRLYCDM